MSDWWNNDGDINVDKDIDVNIDFDLNADVNIDIDKDVNVDVKVNSDADVNGNVSQVFFDVQAHGKDTFTQADIFVITVEDQLSMATGVITSAVN